MRDCGMLRSTSHHGLSSRKRYAHYLKSVLEFCTEEVNNMLKMKLIGVLCGICGLFYYGN